MRIVIAPDSFKGMLSSSEAAGAMAKGIRQVLPDAELVVIPLADGGEGTLEALRSVWGGDMRQGLLCFDDGGVDACLIESAGLIGLNHPALAADLFVRGTVRLGQAMQTALDMGVEHLYIALGGSGTIDGGLGLLMTLGCRVTDAAGRAVSPDLNGLLQVAAVDPGGLYCRLAGVRITLLSDVSAPLCGKGGAVRCYGPQKGLNGDRIDEVEAAMLRWGDLCAAEFNGFDRNRDDGGAAGGLAFALQLLGARLCGGGAFVMAACGFGEAIRDATWVVTGEGCSDLQTLQGKLPMAVAMRAQSVGVNAALISGRVTAPEHLSAIFHAIEACRGSVPESKEQALVVLQQAAARWAARSADVC